MFPGLIPILNCYLENMEVDVDTRCTILNYLKLIKKRASGTHARTHSLSRTHALTVTHARTHSLTVTHSLTHSLFLHCFYSEKIAKSYSASKLMHTIVL